jgi:hypothetical protein
MFHYTKFIILKVMRLSKIMGFWGFGEQYAKLEPKQLRIAHSLRDKPKLFFIQAGQGPSSLPSTEETAIHRKMVSNIRINAKADEAVVLAAYPGYDAWSNT